MESVQSSKKIVNEHFFLIKEEINKKNQLNPQNSLVINGNDPTLLPTNDNGTFKEVVSMQLNATINEPKVESLSNDFPLQTENNNEIQAVPVLYKITNYSDGTSKTEKATQAEIELFKALAPEDNKKEDVKETKENDVVEKNENENEKEKKKQLDTTLDLNADSANPRERLPIITKPGFNIMDRVRSVNKKVNDEKDKDWKNTASYLKLNQEVQDSIEKQNDLKKMYRLISKDDVNGVNTMLQAGHITPQSINDNGAFALVLAVNSGNMDMTKLLFSAGGSPYAIDPKNCYTPEMAQLVEQERYKLNNPITSTLKEAFGLPLTKPKFGH